MGGAEVGGGAVSIALEMEDGQGINGTQIVIVDEVKVLLCCLKVGQYIRMFLCVLGQLSIWHASSRRALTGPVLSRSWL